MQKKGLGWKVGKGLLAFSCSSEDVGGRPTLQAPRASEEPSTWLMSLAGLFFLLVKSIIQRGHVVSKDHFEATPVVTAP